MRRALIAACLLSLRLAGGVIGLAVVLTGVVGGVGPVAAVVGTTVPPLSVDVDVSTAARTSGLGAAISSGYNFLMGLETCPEEVRTVAERMMPSPP